MAQSDLTIVLLLFCLDPQERGRILGTSGELLLLYVSMSTLVFSYSFCSALK